MRRIAATVTCAFALWGCSHGTAGTSSVVPLAANPIAGTPNVRHVVIIMMENRSFDEYFGTFPGVNGIPKNPNCNPDPQTNQCIYPYHDTSLVNGGAHAH